MFEITKIRMRRLKKLAIYGLAIYGIISMVKGCENGTFGQELNKTPASGVEYIINGPAQETNKPISLLETRLQDMYVR